MAKESSQTVWAAIAANLVIAVAKLTAALVSGSSAMFSEAIHSVVDTGNEVLLLIGLRRSELPPDDEHPFGHGKELYFWSLLVAVLLFGIGGGVSVYEGIHRLHDPRPTGDVTWNYVVLGIATIAEGASWFIAARALVGGKRRSLLRSLHTSKDPSVFMVFGEDSAALAGLLIAFVGVLLGQLLESHVPDAVASLLVGLVLCATAAYLAIEIRDLLVGESAEPEVIAAISDVVGGSELALLSRPLTMHFGPERIVVVLEVALAQRSEPAVQVIEQIDALKARIRERVPAVRRVYVSLSLDSR
ncbi:MAG TPA: cation diffusion facilitator family transporter [Polyangiales bacterium]|nr:cation diffusion facilitator family transporter [Polyangiales bacterium]